MFDVSFIKYFIKKLKLFFYIELFITVITLVYLIFVIKPWFRSSTTVLITNSNSNSLLGALSSSLPIGLGSFGQSDASKYIATINTDRMADSVIKRYDLKNIYGSDYDDLIIKEFRENLSVIDNDDNTFSITFDYKNSPEKAAEIVQFIYDTMYLIMNSIDRNNAKNYSTHLEGYLMEKRILLSSSEDSLAMLQTKYNFLDPKLNAELLFTSITEIEKEKSLTELALFLVEQTKGKNHFEYGVLLQKKEFLENKLNDLYNNSKDNLIAVSEIPELSKTYYRLYRTIEVTAKVVEYLQLQYEQSVLDENKITINIQQLSKPRVSDTKVKPKRFSFLIMTIFFTTIFLLVYIRVMYLYENNKDKLHLLFD